MFAFGDYAYLCYKEKKIVEKRLLSLDIFAK